MIRNRDCLLRSARRIDVEHRIEVTGTVLFDACKAMKNCRMVEEEVRGLNSGLSSPSRLVAAWRRLALFPHLGLDLESHPFALRIIHQSCPANHQVEFLS